MNKYKVVAHGRNVWMSVDGQPKLMGFSAPRFLEADTPQLAGDAVVQLIREDNKLRESVINDKTDPPVIDVEEVIAMEGFQEVQIPGVAYFFTKMTVGE